MTLSRSGAVERLARELADAAGIAVELERPGDPSHGDYATNAALRAGGAVRRPPRALAEELAEHARGLAAVDRAEVAGPGFVNLFLADSWFAETLGEMLDAGRDYGRGFVADPEKVQVEMVSANPTGPVTVATGRNAAYGDAIARLLEFGGDTIEREYYWNDAGRQMDRFRESVAAVRRGEPPPEDGYHGDYIAGLAQQEGDPVPRMLEQINATLHRFRVDFDSFTREADLAAEVPAAISRIETYESEGTLWARTTAHGDDKDRPLRRSSDGSFLYFAADVAYLARKLERHDRAIYVLGADHHGYVGRLKAAAAMLGYDPERVEILIYQLVHLTRGGEQTKMSKRRGDVVFLEEFIDEIGIDAARWFLVDRSADQTIDIDVDLASEKSQKNPVYYVQYAHARIAGILRNAGGAEMAARPAGKLAREERELVKRLAEFPALVAEAAERRGPHAVPVYAIRVADDFHRFYHEHRVLESDQQAFRLALCRATQNVIWRALDLVGVAAPDSM
jgi:arginyl-tRNA synthetase